MDSEEVNESSAKKIESSTKKSESSKKRARAESDEDRVKKQKLEDDAEKAELKACLEIVPRDDEVVNVESLATKKDISTYTRDVVKDADQEAKSGS
ncbi:hypothetical protein Tco_0711748 [Tanacetum coccineum]